MSDEKEEKKEEKKKKLTPGVSIKKSNVSLAFTLITFMISDLIFIEKLIPLPFDLKSYDELDKEHFSHLKNKMLVTLQTKDAVHLSTKESILLYLLVDIACKCLVGDTNILLQEKARENMEIEEEEYHQVRRSYIHYAQSLIKEINENFEGNDLFDTVSEELHRWKG